MLYLKSQVIAEGLYQVFSPNEKLRLFIHEYWILHLNRPALHDKGELEQPKIFPEVIFKYGVDYEEVYQSSKQKVIHSSSNVSGVSNYAKASKRTKLQEELLLVGVKFNPLGMFLLLDIPLYELYNQTYTLEEISNNFLKELENQLFYANSYEHIINLLNTKFQQYFYKLNPNNPAKDFYKKFQTGDSYSLNYFLENKQVNYKYLERKFKKYMGVNPKRFLKMIRFSNFYKDWIQRNEYQYIDLVYQHGYYDQNHLIKEFKSFLNVSPSKFLKSMNQEFTQHITKTHL